MSMSAKKLKVWIPVKTEVGDIRLKMYTKLTGRKGREGDTIIVQVEMPFYGLKWIPADALMTASGDVLSSVLDDFSWVPLGK